MSKKNELNQQLHALRETQFEAIKEMKDTFEGGSEISAEKKQAIEDRNVEIEKLNEKVNELNALEIQEARLEEALEKGKEVKSMPIHNEKPEVSKTMGEQLVDSNAYKSFMENGQKNITSELKWNPKVELKTTLTESGYPPAVTRSDLVVPTALRDPQNVIDLIDTITTDNYQYKYLEETTFTNNSSATAEGSALGENALAFTERTENIRKIGSFLPVTEELLADVSAVQGYLDSRLRTMVNLAVGDQILAGSGVAPNLTGILNVSGINTFDFSSFTGNLKRIGQVYEAITEIQKDSFLSPDAIVMHPSDWYQLVTEVNAVTTSGSLNPLFVGAGQFGGGVGQSLWGLPVVLDTTRPAGTCIVGVFGGGQACHIVARQGMEVAMSDSHDANFTKDIIVMKATVRLGFPVYRATAFCTITNF
jgi:HK97 family phage major capsid protein